MKRAHGAHNDDQEAWKGPPVAVLWDQSLVWGLICLETLRQLGVPFHLACAKEIVEGCLDRHRVLVVPGGWASHKMRNLGEAGKIRIQQFVQSGGSYLGFCGGAGLALSSPPSLGLVPLERMPLAERLPNASGEIWIQGAVDHPLWEGLPLTVPVSIWWPSQFGLEVAPGASCLATYKSPGADFWVADLPLSDLNGGVIPWEEWEKVYGINLNPARLLGHPAILEMRAGKGRVVLSYPHLDTPGDAWANRLFRRCLRYLDDEASRDRHLENALKSSPAPFSARPGRETIKHMESAREAVDALIAFGERHLLWTWRRPWLLNWRRGIRGLEYGTLAVVMGQLFDRLSEMSCEGGVSDDPWLGTAKKIEEEVIRFCRLARDLLIEEKLAAKTRNLTKLGEVNASVDQLRGQLFGNKMNHGGLCRELFDELDRFVWEVMSDE